MKCLAKRLEWCKKLESHFEKNLENHTENPDGAEVGILNGKKPEKHAENSDGKMTQTFANLEKLCNMENLGKYCNVNVWYFGCKNRLRYKREWAPTTLLYD